MATANQLIRHDIAEKHRVLYAGRDGVTYNHDVAFVHDRSVHESGVIRGPRAAPTPRLHLQLHPFVGYFQQSRGSLEETAAEVGDEAECVDVGAEDVYYERELIGLANRVELRLVAHEIVESGVALGMPGGELEEIQVGTNLYRGLGDAKATRHPCSLTVEAREQ